MIIFMFYHTIFCSSCYTVNIILFLPNFVLPAQSAGYIIREWSYKMNNPILQLASDFFVRLNLHHMLIDFRQTLDSDVDLGLRRLLSDKTVESISDFKNLDGAFFEQNLIYFCVDRYHCHYLLMPVPRQETPIVFLAGPFLTSPPNTASIQKLMRHLTIPPSLLTALSQYYSTLPMISQENILEPFAASLGDSLYGPGQYAIRYLSQRMEADTNFDPSASSVEITDNSIRELERRYEIEEKMMDCIAHGDIDGALRCTNDSVFSSLDNRAASALRSRKNYMIILNTLCRKGAQRGGVHPVYLDELSRRIALSIENMTSLDEDKDVSRDMVRRYCMLVRSSSTENYTPIIADVINYIQQHLSEPDLTLSRIAAQLKVNRTYLSSLFSKETGTTLTAFINARRIDQAIFLLNSQNLPIQNIADACGIPDVTYFTRIFKKEKGMTPSAYKKMIRG